MRRNRLRWQRSGRCRPLQIAVMLAVLVLATIAGCISYDLQTLRRVARIADYGSEQLVTVRKTPQNPLANQLNLLSHQGPQPSPRTEQLLRRYDLETLAKKDPREALSKLEKYIDEEPTADKVYAFAELAYVNAKRAEGHFDQQQALDMYGAAVAHAYIYLFDPRYDAMRNAYDPEFRGACELYNEALEGALRIVDKQGNLRPGYTHTVETCGRRLDIGIVVRGPWHADDFERFEFVSDYELKGLNNKYQTFGLGVPLIAVRHQHADQSPDEKYYPPGLSFPVTAFLRVLPSQRLAGAGTPPACQCALELYDPLGTADVEVAGHVAPLESDISTPLAYYLNDPLVKTNAFATFALLNADFAKQFKGLYMLEPYDPDKIPVVMVHGLWSSPVTWMEMFNDLHALPELRKNYQFWFYLYPTGQPFWISAKQFREDLAEARQTLDPRRTAWKLDQTVLVGHSMGGLVSRLQTIDSGDDFWHIVSDRPFAELKADDETRQALHDTVFFTPNPSVRRVITLGTPHRGSNFANPITRWISHTLIRLPEMFTSSSRRVIRENPGFFRNTDLLTITTSIDSLAPDSPIYPVLEHARKASWVKYHNVVGIAPGEGVLGKYGSKVSGKGDGVVALASATLEVAESQIEVPADHVTIHQHPRTILEVRRILLRHLDDVSAEVAARGPASLGPVAQLPLGDLPTGPTQIGSRAASWSIDDLGSRPNPASFSQPWPADSNAPTPLHAQLQP